MPVPSVNTSARKNGRCPARNVKGRRRITGEEEMDDRTEAIDILTRMSTNHFYGHREQEAFKLGAEALKQRWVTVTERLPEEDYETGNGVQFSADVLATIVNHANDGELYVWLLKTVDGKWYDYTPNEDGTHEIPYWCEVIAWMPLPTPYKGGEEE